MAYSFYFSIQENLDFPEFPQKKFYNINYWSVLVEKEILSIHLLLLKGSMGYSRKHGLGDNPTSLPTYIIRKLQMQFYYLHVKMVPPRPLFLIF